VFSLGDIYARQHISKTRDMLPGVTLRKIAELMVIAERTIAAGANRKTFVINQLKSFLGDAEYAKVEPFVDLAIETIIMISHAEIDIKKINPKSWCCCK
jgi:hypothetical protein